MLDQHDPLRSYMSYVAVVALEFPQVAECVRASVWRQPALGQCPIVSWNQGILFVGISTDPHRPFLRESPWVGARNSSGRVQALAKKLCG